MKGTNLRITNKMILLGVNINGMVFESVKELRRI